jgi:hypothetical protein
MDWIVPRKAEPVDLVGPALRVSDQPYEAATLPNQAVMMKECIIIEAEFERYTA